MDQYYYKEEIKLKGSDYSFASQMQNDARNNFWQRKEGLWTLLSAACDDTAKQFYEHLDSYANDILDLETCNIHSLKSMAKSVDLEFLTKHIKEDYPEEILKLINLLSIPRYILLNTNRILHDDANLKMFGSITKRSSEIFFNKDISINLILDIKENIFKIGKLLKKFTIYETKTLENVFKRNLPDLSIIFSNFNYSIDVGDFSSLSGTFYDFGFDPSTHTIAESYDNDHVVQYYVLTMTLNDLYNAINFVPYENLKYFKKQKLIVEMIDVSGEKRKVINHFYLLINIIKQNFFNKEGNFILDGVFHDENGTKHDIRDLITEIVSPIHMDNESYLNDFVTYHFYNLIKDKLFNDNIKQLYNKIILHSNNYKEPRELIRMKEVTYSDYNKGEFESLLGDFISPDEIEKFIKSNNITNYTKSLVEFIEYLNFLKIFISKDENDIDYDLISINFPSIVGNDLYKKLFENGNSYDDINNSNFWYKIEPYNSTKTYKNGDIVIEGNLVKKFSSSLLVNYDHNYKTSYNLNEIIISGGIFYKALKDDVTTNTLSISSDWYKIEKYDETKTYKNSDKVIKDNLVKTYNGTSWSNLADYNYKTYDENDIVIYNGIFYKSLKNENSFDDINNSNYWYKIELYNESIASSYKSGDIVISSNYVHTYNGSKWELTNYNNDKTSYNLNETIVSGGIFYKALKDGVTTSTLSNSNNWFNGSPWVNYDHNYKTSYNLNDIVIYNGIFYKSLKDDDSYVMQLAKHLADIAMEVSYIREEIKENVIKYGYIGTKAIVVNVLSDFYLKNFTDKRDWSYQLFNIQVDSSKNILSSLLKPTSSYLNNIGNKFSVNLIEYYDTTEYLNIESNLGDVKVGEQIIGYEDVEKFYLDSNSLITSSLVKEPLYKDVFLPCSFFTTNFNQRFWESIPKVTYENLSNYEQFLSQFVNLRNLNHEKIEDINELQTLFGTIWDEFALSGFSGEENSDISELFIKYIGRDEGKNKFLNHKNEIFPTIAPFQNIEGLIETSKFSDDILFVTKVYYSSVIDIMKNATSDILKMYNNEGVPFENWKKSYIPFHGYSSKHNYSTKQDSKGNESKYINVDGPWSYSGLKEILLNKLLIEEDGVDNFLSLFLVNDNYNNFTLINLYKKYIFGDDETFNLDSDECINNYKIDKIDQDIYLNFYTLFKKDGEVSGKLFFRGNDTLISLPIHEFFKIEDGSNNTNIKSLVNICNKCIDFSVYEDFIWVYGHDETCYRLAIFKIEYRDSYLYIVDDSLTYIGGSDTLNNRLEQLNDFIGAYKNDKKNEAVFIMCDFENELIKSSKEIKKVESDKSYDYSFLNSFLFNLYIIEFSLEDHTIERKILEINDIVFPAIMEITDDNKFKVMNSHRIWNFKSINGINYLCYESLNKSSVNEIVNTNDNYKHGHYYNLDVISNTLSIEVLNVQWIKTNNYINENSNNGISILFSKYKNETLLFDEISGNNKIELEEKMKGIINSYPICYTKNGVLNMDLLPYSFIEKPTINFDKLITEWETNNSSSITTFITFFNGVKNDVRKNYYYHDFLEKDDEISNLSSTLSSFLTNISNGELLKPYESQSGILSAVITGSFESSFDIMTNTYNYNTNYMYENFPILSKCITNLLEIKIEYFNETGVDFVHEWALDVDTTCYINDLVEVNKKVGYGNKYKETSYISWSGDKQSEGVESYTIDIEKYINSKNINTKINNNMEIVLNVCWNENSQLMNDNVYVIISYRGITERFKLDKVGISKKSCNNRSLVLHVDMNSKSLTYEVPRRYMVLSIAKKRFLVELKSSVPDIKVGFIELTNSELRNLNKHFKDKGSCLVYESGLYENLDESGYHQNTLILFKDFSINTDDNKIVLKLIKEKMDKMFYKYSDVKSNIKKYKDLVANDIFFGVDIDNVDEIFGINFIYYAYFRKKYFEPYRHNHDESMLVDDDRSYQSYICMSPELRALI